jgi:Phosphorylase superfamily
MIAVTFALPAESSAFIRLLKGVRRDGALLRGNIQRPTPNVQGPTLNVCVLHTGVGAAKCAERIGDFLGAEKPDLLIASGFCGGTNDELQPGDLVIAENAVDMETETIWRLCAAESIPMLALRVVSDSPAAPFPAPPNVLFDIEKQRTDFSRLLGYIARNPIFAIRLAEFSKQITAAKAKLGDALCAVLRAL